jgi:hypothetical protein
VEHVAIGQVATERQSPGEEDGVLLVPIYEEQLVVVKRLLLWEQVRVRRVGISETQLFEEPLRRERLVVEDPSNTGLVYEQFSTTAQLSAPRRGSGPESDEAAGADDANPLERLVRKMFQQPPPASLLGGATGVERGSDVERTGCHPAGHGCPSRGDPRGRPHR